MVNSTITTYCVFKTFSLLIFFVDVTIYLLFSYMTQNTHLDNFNSLYKVLTFIFFKHIQTLNITKA